MIQLSENQEKTHLRFSSSLLKNIVKGNCRYRNFRPMNKFGLFVYSHYISET